MLLLWIAALNYRPHQPYIPAPLAGETRPRWKDGDDEDWLILHTTGREWM